MCAPFQNSSEPTNSALHFFQQVAPRVFRNVASLESEPQALHRRGPCIAARRAKCMACYGLHAFTLKPCRAVVTPKLVPLNKPLEETQEAVRPLGDCDATLSQVSPNVSNPPAPAPHREVHRDAGDVEIVATFSVGFISSQPHVRSARQMPGQKCSVRLNLQHPGTPTLPPVWKSILLFDQALESPAHNWNYRLAEKLSKTPPMLEHFRWLIARWRADVDIFSRLDLGEPQRHRGTVLASAKCDYVQHALPSFASVVSSVYPLADRPEQCRPSRQERPDFSGII